MSPAPSVQTVLVDGHRLRLTNPDKVLYPGSGTTKAEVISYLMQVAPLMLPHLADRICTRKRWPEGVGSPIDPGEVFFEKNLPDHAPKWMRRQPIEHGHQTSTYPVVESSADLAWLGQMNALELHVPQWRLGSEGEPLNPDRLVLDLDPGPGAGLPQCAEVAHEARSLLQDIGLETYPVTSGSKGLHLYAPLDGDLDSDYVNEFAKTLAKALEQQLPKLVVSTQTKSQRAGKVLVDWSQNNAAKTTISPYSLRGTFHPFVAAPRTWDEIDDDLTQLDLEDMLDRLGEDPLEPLVSRVVASAPPTSTSGGIGPARSRGPVSVMLASPAKGHAYDAHEWAFEMKWDGYRAIAIVDDQGVTLRSRNGKDLSDACPEVTEALFAADIGNVVLDGELVAFDDDGAPDFGLLQQRVGLRRPADAAAASQRTPLSYLAFDLLEHNGESLRSRTYEERRDALEALGLGDSVVQVPPRFDGDLNSAIAASFDQGLEGVMAKRRASTYRGERSSSWLKIKHKRTHDVVIIGWSPGKAGRSGSIGALVLGVHRDGELTYAGKVGSGFSDAALANLRTLLSAIPADEAPVDGVPREVAKEAHWVRPELVGEVGLSGWTHGGHVRHATWKGLRDDVAVDDVRIETT